MIGLLAVAACDEAGTGPLMEELTPAEALELAVLEDEASYGIPVELTAVEEEVAAALGDAGTAEGRGFASEARLHFQFARRALAEGHPRRALEEAREARRLIARAVLVTGGRDALAALIERLDELALTADEDEEVFDDAGAVADELAALAAAARDLLARGDSVGAGERALLGEQRARYRRGRPHVRGDVAPARARLAVALAETAVGLAERLIAAQDVPPRDAVSDAAQRQNRWLLHAERMLERAQTALANGYFARAVHFAEHSQWSALKAVVLPGGVTEAEIEAIVKVADNLYGQAEEAIGTEPTELERLMLVRAGRLIEHGKTMLEEGHQRGIAPLWRASVICAWLLG